ncbi:hypothetical protein AWU65_14520 [Paenibacillus glucanolyticus]|uniref:UDP-N-acetylglucosamine kinase n=1 Tax=Paenibacillus glucanolyticus TaxID=59843 RepID=A0A163K8D0_9BACL|nr:hypothetical protein [Paenibacillus glucanolyticus]KZS47052.1 hypothetical protein AWU65_14520 [Paenibacillus glucanolyticus]
MKTKWYNLIIEIPIRHVKIKDKNTQRRKRGANVPIIRDCDLKQIYNHAKMTVRIRAAAAGAPLYYILDGKRYCEEHVQISDYIGNSFGNVKEVEALPGGSQPEMFVFAGCNGAGKTTLIDHFKYKFHSIINADFIAKRMNPENPRSVDLSAGKEALLELRTTLEGCKTFAVETTLSGKHIIKQMNIAKRLGYKIYLYFIGLADVQLHTDRVHTRVIEGGHFISSEDIGRRYYSSLSNLETAVSLADVSVLIDNSRNEYMTVAEISHGQIHCRIDELPQWLRRANLGN